MKTFIPARAAIVVGAMVLSTAAFAAGGHGSEIQRQQWPFGGFKGQFDKNQLQRGFLVYKEVCASCHGLKRLNFRNLSEPGGPEFPETAIKKLAADWPYQIPEVNDAGEIAGKGGELLKRPAKPSDPVLGPYANDAAARAVQTGALPPDLSIIAKARSVARDPQWLVHPFLMLGDIFRGYQEGGADYLYALLTGYTDAPADVKVMDGMYYNSVVPGHQLAMPSPLSEGRLTAKDGYMVPPTVDNMARDVTAFLSWSADPSLNQRKRIGWQVMLYLLVTTLLLYLGKRRIWSKLH